MRFVRIQESVEIERSPQEVWDFVADPAKDPLWCRKVSLEHVRLEPTARLVLRQDDKASVFDVEYRLVPTATWTRFTQASEFRWKKLPRFLHGLFAAGVRRDVRRQLRGLKSILERETAARY